MADKVSGDKFDGDKIAGDKVGGNKGDTYNIEHGVGVGRNVRMTGTNVTQARTQGVGQIDMPTLAQELSVLLAEMNKQKSEPEHQMAIGAVAAAEMEAKKGEGSKALQYLSKAGEWALEVATKIGVSVATEAIKKSAGL
jgi:hypothetical protein